MHRFLVVTFVAFLAWGAIASASADIAEVSPKFPSPVENGYAVGIKRLLRTDEHDTEDRAINLSGLTKFSEQVSSMVSKAALNLNLQARLAVGQSSNHVSKILITAESVDDILSNPNFNTLVKYVHDFNTRFPKKQVPLIKVLSDRYGEAAVAEMLVSAKNVPATETWATKLQDSQISGWIEMKDPLKVFRILKLNDRSTYPLTSQSLKAWEKYKAVLRNDDPANKITTVEAFRAEYTDMGLARYLLTHRGEEKAEEILGNLFDLWSRTRVTMENIDQVVFKSAAYTALPRIDTRIKAEYKEYLEQVVVPSKRFWS